MVPGSSFRAKRISLSLGLALTIALAYIFLKSTLVDYYPKYSDFKPDTGLRTEYVEAEVLQEDGALRYSRSKQNAKTDLLWLAVTYDNTSWGMGTDHVHRGISNLTDLIASQYSTEKTALGILTSSRSEYDIYKSVLRQLSFPRVNLFLHNGFEDGQVIDYEHRHDGDVQKRRRAEISKIRNYIMLQTLEEQTHILWSDADVYFFDENIVRRMIQHIETNDRIGILTARCTFGTGGNYDLNAWDGTRQGPRGWDLDRTEIDAGEMRLQGQHLVEELVEGTGNDDLKDLNTVGATILYMRASLIWQGLNFPHQYVVGTRWMKDGWDGIESEGLCYRARGLKGGGCAVLGGSWHVEHSIG